MRVQRKTYDKNCVICNKKFIANREHAKTCSEACRAQKNANTRAIKMVSPAIIEAAKPAIIAEARVHWLDELVGKYKSVIIPDEYKQLVFELANLRGKDKYWIDGKIRLYQKFTVEDPAWQEDAMELIQEEIVVYKNIGVKSHR